MAVVTMKTTCTIADGASLSDAVVFDGLLLEAIALPAGWDTAAITFEVSLDGGTTYQRVLDSTATEVSVSSVAASRTVVLAPAFPLRGTHVKLRSGTAGAAVAQSGAVVLTLLMRRYQ